MRLAARIEGVGLVGPGLESWPAARIILAGEAPYEPRPTVLPMPEALPPTERRRASKSVRVSLAAGLAAVADARRSARDMVSIFASSSGDGDTCHAICEALASDDRLISPTRFHNSVHNAPAGYWGIATGAMAAADSLAAFDASFAAGLLEAMGRIAAAPDVPVLLVSYDAPYPEPLNATRPILDSFAVGLVLGRDSGEGLGIAIETTRDAPERMSSEPLERVRVGIPSARVLPLLQRVAKAHAGRVVLDYLDDLALAVELRK
jgi:hypothetical protein